jgi:hypothetical protein
LCHAGHFVATVHGMFGMVGRLRLVMPVNRALGTGGAASLRIERQCGRAERRVKEGDSDETERCKKRAPTVLVLNSHLRPKLSKSYAREAPNTQDFANRMNIPA